jgi:hypothetical protein
MGFQWPAGLWFLWIGPLIILFYLLKRKYADTPVSSHMLWSRVQRDIEATRPWQKLCTRLLMLLQLLAALIGVLAVAGFFMWRGGGTEGHTVYVLDGSGSMGARISPAAGDAAEDRLSVARSAILDHAKKEGNDVSRSLILMSGEPVVLLSHEASIAKLEEALKEAEPVWGQASYRESLSLAGALADKDEHTQIVLVTDGQWVEETEPQGISVPVAVLPVRAGEDDSAGIVRFGVAAPLASSRGAQTGGPSGELPAHNGIAVIKNWGSNAVETQAAIYAGDQLVTVEKAALGPGEERQWSFNGLPAADWYKLVLSSSRDAIAADNTAYAFPAAGKRKTVLVAGQGNLFLEKALQLAQADVIIAQRQNGVYSLPRSDVDLVVLDGTAQSETSTEGWEKLLAGKPVWSIRPVKGAEGVDKETVGEVAVSSHPVMKYIRWEQVHVAGALKLSEAGMAGLTPVLSKGELPLVLAGGEDGKRRLVFTFGLADSDLGLRPDFPILTQNAVSWLTEDAGGVIGTGLAGQPLALSLSPEAASAEWEAVEAVHHGDDLPAGNGSSPVPAYAPADPGLFRLVEKDAAGHTVRSRYYAAAADIRESDLKALPDTGFLTEETAAGAAGEIQEQERPPFDLTPWLAAAMIALLAAEWEVYRRGTAI